MVRCPWIHFLTLVPTSGIPKLQIELLRSKLDVLARANFDCAFVDIMDSGKANFPPWGWMYDAEYYRDQPAVDLHYALSSEMRLILHGGYQISAMTYEALYRAAEQLAVVIPTIDPLLGQSSSSSFIQSGHSYRRDNPSIPRTTRDTARPAVQEVIVSANRPTRALFSINSKQEKLIDRLYRQREGNVGWASVVDVSRYSLWFRISGESLLTTSALQADWIQVSAEQSLVGSLWTRADGVVLRAWAVQHIISFPLPAKEGRSCSIG